MIDQASQRLEIDSVDQFQRRRPEWARLMFQACIRVAGSTLRAGALGRDTATAEDLMSATVEVKTGERSVIFYPLSPIARSVSEAGREQ
ncbi:MAG: hypothetical protein AAGI03_02800 [Pseudomonadota bacterium]